MTTISSHRSLNTFDVLMHQCALKVQEILRKSDKQLKILERLRYKKEMEKSLLS